MKRYNKVSVSVIMSVYNGENTVKEALDSLLAQTLKTIEILIVNDGSTDATKKILSTYRDNRIVVYNRSNVGLTKSLIYAAGLAKGKYLARQDADDISLPSRLQKQYEFLENEQKFALVGSQSLQIDSENDVLGTIDMPTSDEDIDSQLFQSNQFVHGSVMMRKEVYNTIGGYRPQFRFSQDYDLFLRISEKYKVANLSEVLYQSRHNLNMVSLHYKEDQLYYAKCARKLAMQRNGDAVVDQLDMTGELPNISRASNQDNSIQYYKHLISSFLRQGNMMKVRQSAFALLKVKPMDFHTWIVLMVSFLGDRIVGRLLNFLDRFRLM